MNSTIANTTNRPLIILASILFLLAIPFIAMQFTDEVQWSLLDFLIAGTLLAFAGGMIELTLRLVQKSALRWLILAGIVALLLLVWVELAVGVFGTPFEGS